MTDVDQAHLGRLLTHLEALVHRDGWDKPCAAWLLYDTADSELDGVVRRVLKSHPHAHQEHFAARRFLVLVMPPGEESMPPWEMMRNYCFNLAWMHDQDEKAEMIFEVFSHPAVLGFAASTEGWLNSDREACDRAIRGEVHLGDVPGSVEERVVWAVDRTGRVHRSARIRGSKPTLELDIPTIRGDFTTSLRILVDAINGERPDSQEAWNARYPTLHMARFGYEAGEAPPGGEGILAS